jgi:hypothetical protein
MMHLEEKHKRIIQESLEVGGEILEQIPESLRSSEEFRQYYEQMRKLYLSISRMEELAPPVDLTADIMAQLRAEGLLAPRRARLFQRIGYFGIVLAFLISSIATIRWITMGEESFLGKAVLAVISFMREVHILAKLWGYIGAIGSGLWALLEEVARIQLNGYGIGLFIGFTLLLYACLILVFPRWQKKPSLAGA